MDKYAKMSQQLYKDFASVVLQDVAQKSEKEKAVEDQQMDEHP